MAAITGQYRATPVTYTDKDFVEVLPTDVNGNLMVNVAAGEVIAVSAGTITSGTINTGTITAGSIVVTAGTIAAGTLNTVGKYASFLGTVIVPTSDTVTSATVTSTINGIVRGLTFVTPALTGTGTSTLTLVDASGGSLISQAQNESVTAYYGTIVPVTTSMNWIVTANGTQDAAGTHKINVHYEL